MKESQQIKYKKVQVEYSEDYTSCNIYIDKRGYNVPFGSRKRFDSKYGFIIMIPYNKRITIKLIYQEFNKWVNNILWKGGFASRIEAYKWRSKWRYNNLVGVLFFYPKHENQLITYRKLLLSHVNAKLSLFDTWYSDRKHI